MDTLAAFHHPTLSLVRNIAQDVERFNSPQV